MSLSLEIGKNIYAKEFPPTYELRPQVEKLSEFLRRGNNLFSEIDPIQFLVEQVYIQHHSNLPSENNVHKQLIEKLAFDNELELPRLYREFYYLLEGLFSRNKKLIDEAMPYLFEKLSAIALESQYRCIAGNNRKFFIAGPPKSLRYEYYDMVEKKPRYKEEVDVVTVPKDGDDQHALGECKTSVFGFTKSLQISYSFLEYLANIIEQSVQRSVIIVFIFPTDASKIFNNLVSKISHKKTVFALSLVKWKENPVAHKGK